MARGRKLTSSRSERYLGSYGYGNGSGQGANGDVTELGEEDVWSTVGVDDVVGERNDSVLVVNNSQGEWSARAVGQSNGGLPTRSRRRSERHVGGLSLAFDFDDSGKTASSGTTAATRIVHQFRGSDGLTSSAAAASPRGGHHMAASAPVNVPDWSKIYRVDSVESMHDSDDDRDMEMVPPHEYLARSRRTEGASVFEGVGRTLKGRDLRRVRDAVWSQTGFDG